jgi:hypothetical protein
MFARGRGRRLVSRCTPVACGFRSGAWLPAGLCCHAHCRQNNYTGVPCGEMMIAANTLRPRSASRTSAAWASSNERRWVHATVNLILPLLLALVFLIGVGQPAASAAAPLPRVSDGTRVLRFVSAPGYTFALTGTGWGAYTHVAFLARSASSTAGLLIRATQHGVFEVGMMNVNRCAGVTVRAQDTQGHRLRLGGPRLSCPVPIETAMPKLKVLKGADIRGAARI